MDLRYSADSDDEDEFWRDLKMIGPAFWDLQTHHSAPWAIEEPVKTDFELEGIIIGLQIRSDYYELGWRRAKVDVMPTIYENI